MNSQPAGIVVFDIGAANPPRHDHSVVGIVKVNRFCGSRRVHYSMKTHRRNMQHPVMSVILVIRIDVIGLRTLLAVALHMNFGLRK